MGYIYSLRIGICPDFMAEEKFLLLEQFCEKSGVDDVQFFINMEEVNDGHLTMEETKPWLDMIASFIPRLRARGISVSLNPWITTLHTDRGRKLKPGQNFTTMVDYKGNQAQAVACPLCPDFQKYIRKMYSAYAALGFDVIWVEDDFRLHNHAPLEWGGCFCSLHMKEFERRAGRKLSREDFVKNISRPGTPHPDRAVWLDTMRDTMNGFAALLGDAVHAVAPDTRVALMSSGPQAHAAEGRDWKAVFSGLAGKKRPLDRPHLPAYNEVSGRQYCLEFQRYSRLTAAVVPEDTELWPELDNFPHTRFSKSHKFAGLEMESTLSIGAEGITINIFDMMGNGIAEREKNEKLLSERKPYLQAVQALGAKRAAERGVCVLVEPDTVRTLYADEAAAGPQALVPRQTFWAEYLSAFGIANHMAKKPALGETVAVSGQYFRSKKPEEIRALAREHCLLLDGDSVEILLERGCGDVIGAESARWHPLNGGYQSYEQVETGLEVYGLSQARMSAQALYEKIESGDYLEITYAEQPEEITSLRTPRGERAGAGLCRAKNAIVLPYGKFRESYQMLLNPVRKELLLALLQQTGTAYVSETQFVTLNHFEVEQGHMILLTNYATDDFETPLLYVPFAWTKCFYVDRISGKLCPTELTREGELARLGRTLFSMRSECLLFR